MNFSTLNLITTPGNLGTKPDVSKQAVAVAKQCFSHLKAIK